MISSIALLLSMLAPDSVEKIRVVATLPDLRAIAQAVGGEWVDVVSLCAGKQDPHFVDPKPSFIVRLRDADLFFCNGLDLEIGWIPPLLESARNPRILPGAPGYFDASRFATIMEIPAGEITRAQGDVHPLGNPHYLLDPLNGLDVARALANKLRQLRPEQAKSFEENLARFQARLLSSLFGPDLVAIVGGEKLERLAREGELDRFLSQEHGEEKPLESKLGGWLGRMRVIRGTRVVAYHKTLSYLAHRFGLLVVGYVEPKPGIPPSPSYVAELIEQIKKDRVPFVLTHSFYEEQLPRRVAQSAGARVVVLPAAVDGVSEAKDYFSLFDAIVDRLTQGH